MYIFQLMDMYAASGISLLWVALFQTVAVSWVFGVDKFAQCVQEMTGINPGAFWRLCWQVLAPAVMLVGITATSSVGLPSANYLEECFTHHYGVQDRQLAVSVFYTVFFCCFRRMLQGIFLWSVVQYVPIRYGSYEYPAWGEALGLLISSASMVWIPGYAVYYLLTTKGTLKEVGIAVGFMSIHIQSPPARPRWGRTDKKQIKNM